MELNNNIKYQNLTNKNYDDKLIKTNSFKTINNEINNELDYKN